MRSASMTSRRGSIEARPGAGGLLRRAPHRHVQGLGRLIRERFKRAPFPAWSLDAIRFLYEQRGIVANGHESMDTDATDDLKSEAWLLKHGHWQIEVMANLDKVPATGALIVVTWPKPEHGLGFPARAFAILP